MVPGTKWELEEYLLKEGREGNASETSLSILQKRFRHAMAMMAVIVMPTTSIY